MGDVSQEDRLSLFRKIVNYHFMTNHSSIDFLYPPEFIWKSNEDRNLIPVLKDLDGKFFDLYIHFPYCRQKCTFCRQYSFAEDDPAKFREYVDYVIKEMRIYKEYAPNIRIGSIFLGGGTPTLFDLRKVVDAIRKTFVTVPGQMLNVETTFEDLDKKKLKELYDMGTNRLVIGIQSLDSEVGKRINRIQDKRKFIDMVSLAKDIGIDTVNAEIVGGLPDQKEESLLQDIRTVMNSRTDSIHIYKFIPTPLAACYNEIGDMSEAIARNDRMVSAGMELLRSNGYRQQWDNDFTKREKLWNFTRREFPDDYRGQLAMGVSGIGQINPFSQQLRYINHKVMKNYVAEIDNGRLPVNKDFHLVGDEYIRCRVIANLRYDKLDIDTFNKKNGVDVRSSLEKEWKDLEKAGAIIKEGRRTRLRNWLVTSKYLYSPDVLLRCKKAIENAGVEVSDDIQHLL